MKTSKKRTMNELRQSKDFGYKPPIKDEIKEEPEKQLESMQYLANGLRYADEKGLLIEVVYHALQAMKNNPKLKITEAFEAGCDEWDI